MRRYFAPLLVVVTVALVIAASSTHPAAPAAAATSFTVSSTTDEPDASPGNGICASAPSGVCTLRAAIMEANALPGADTILLPAGTYELTRRGDDTFVEDASVNDLDISSEIRIIGAAAPTTLVGHPSAYLGISRVFRIGPAGVADIAGVTIRGGQDTGYGAGILNAGRLTLGDSAISGNGVQYAGGGLYNHGTATLERVLIFENFAVNSGHGEFGSGGGIANVGTLALRNVTLSGNRARAAGHAIYNAGAGSGELANVTLVDNGTSAGMQTIYGSSRLRLSNTIMSRVDGANCSGGPPESLGHNIDNGATCGLSGPNDLSRTDPRLGPLGDNGGPTATYALLPGSPAIDRGRDPSCPSTDQRGMPRPRDGNADSNPSCDIGAYELQQATAPDLRVSLRLLTVNGGEVSPAGIIAGSTFTADIGVSNGGLAPATDVRLTIGHVNAIYSNGPISGATCSPSTPTEIRCQLGALGVGQERSIQVPLVAGPADSSSPDRSLMTVTASATAAETEANMADNSASTTRVIHPPPCSPRQDVVIMVTPAGPGRLQVGVRAPWFSLGTNRVLAVRLGRLENAHVEYAGRSYTSGEELTFGPNTYRDVDFVVIREQAGRATHAPFVVMDTCGEWPSFVGGGPTAF